MSIELLPWVISRATGFLAFGLFGLAMIAGLLIRTRGSIGSLRGGGMVDLHRHLSLLALLAVAVHAGALLFDTTLDAGPTELLVPGALNYRPLWTGLGVVAAELALLIHVSFALRTRIGPGLWRKLHWLAYAVFGLGAVHGILSGTDTSATWALAIYAGIVAAVAALTAWRAVGFRRPRRGNREARGGAGAARAPA